MSMAEGARDATGAIDLLGGAKTIGSEARTAMDAHDILLKGLPSNALLHLVDTVSFLSKGDALQNAVGISIRTLQRHRSSGTSRKLSLEQGNRTWRFAEIFAQATQVMGSEEAAEAWMNRPAIGLDNHRPIELLATSAGAEAVEDHLTRLEYGVYT